MSLFQGCPYRRVPLYLPYVEVLSHEPCFNPFVDVVHTLYVHVATDTVAVRQADGSFKLYGYKWFTSATDANIAFTLARVQDPDGLVTPV